MKNGYLKNQFTNGSLKLFIVGVIVLTIGILGTIHIHKTIAKTNQIKEEMADAEINIVTAKIFDFEMEVYEYIKQLNIAHPDIVLIQARIESGNFTSNLFLEHNNMFGMKLPYRRPTTAVGSTKSGYAVYNSWEESVIDYALYQAYSAKNLSEKEYISHLNNYAQDSLYTDKIKKYIGKK